MKTKLILGSLLALTSLSYAQNTVANGSGSGNVGINTTSPLFNLDVHASTGTQGIRIYKPSGTTGSSALHIHNATTGGKNWSIYSLGSGDGWTGPGGLAIANSATSAQFVINGSTGNVGIGMNSGASIINPDARLDVKLDAAPSGLDQIASRGRIKQTVSVGAGSFKNYIGVEGNAGTIYTNENYMIGVKGSADLGLVNYGLHGSAIGGTLACGIYGTASGGTQNWAGYFAGNVYATGSYASSDRKLKNNIKSVEGALNKIMLLKPSTYTFKREEFEKMNLPAGKQIGLIAQELEEVFPELIAEMPERTEMNAEGEKIILNPAFKSIQYTSLIPVLISGIQEQQSTIQSQQKQLDEQKQLIETLTQKVAGTTGINNLNSVETGFQMSQNEPNPFTHETLVKYTLPQTVANAFMAVYDLTGKQITTFPITEKGSSALTITSEKLAAGIYIYSIVADGKVLDSKRMIVAEK